MKKIIPILLLLVIVAFFIVPNIGTNKSLNEKTTSASRDAAWYKQANLPGTNEFREKLYDDIAVFQAKATRSSIAMSYWPGIMLIVLGIIGIAAAGEKFDAAEKKRSQGENINNAYSSQGFVPWNGKAEPEQYYLKNNTAPTSPKQEVSGHYMLRTIYTVCFGVIIGMVLFAFFVFF